MNDAEIRRQMTRGCAWWRTPVGWELDDPDLKKVSQSPLRYEPEALADISPGGLYVLRGPRRVGKSVEVKRAISTLINRGISTRRIIHFSCDGLKASELRQIYRVGADQATAGVTEPRYWFFDEITSVSGWPAAIKWLRDNTSLRDDCVVLTGSSSRDLDAARNELAGRRGTTTRSDRLLLPMSFRAFCHQMDSKGLPDVPVIRAADFLGVECSDAAAELEPWIDQLCSWWEVYCQCGGLPPAVAGQLQNAAIPARFVTDLFDIIHGDALARSRATPTQSLALLAGLAKRVGSPINMSDLGRELGVDPKTADSRIQDLIDCYLAWPCHQRGDHSFPNLAAQGKVYFADPLLARIAHLRNPALPEPDTSVISEQQIGQHLLRQRAEGDPGTYADFSGLMSARNASRNEVDFVGPAVGVLGFEGKYSDNRLEQESATVRSICGNRGVLASRALLGKGKEPGHVLFVPAAFVAFLLAD